MTAMRRFSIYYDDVRTAATFVVVVVLATLLVTANDDDLSGEYCAIKGCCTDRQDECSAPILDTLCYCDSFCDNRNKSADCCPDYWSVCKGNDPLKMTTPSPSLKATAKRKSFSKSG